MFKYVAKKGNNLKDYSKEVAQVDRIVEESKEIKNMAKQVFNYKEKIKDAKVENFKEAKERMGLSDVDILESLYSMTKMFYISFYISIPVFCLMIYFVATLELMSAGITLAVLGILLANCFKFSFRAFQIRKKSLCPVSDWLAAKKEWLPPKMTEKDFFQMKSVADEKEKKRIQKSKEELKKIQEEFAENEKNLEQRQKYFEGLKDEAKDWVWTDN